MRNYEPLKACAKNGVIKTKDVEKNGIAKDYLQYAIADGILEKVVHGVYVLMNELVDTLFVFQIKYPQAIFSSYTSAFLLDLTTRDVEKVYASVPQSYNNPKLKEDGVAVLMRDNKDAYSFGVIQIKNSFGNSLLCHDPERTVCDFFNPKYIGDKFVQVEVLKNYLQSKEKNLAKLFDYAKKLGVLEELRKRVEVLL